MRRLAGLGFRRVVIGLFLNACSLVDDGGNFSTSDLPTATTEADSSDSEEFDSNIHIIVPEVYSAGERIGYLLEIDDTAVLKIWDDESHRIFRINEKTGFLLGVPEPRYYLDDKCTIPLLMISAAGFDCGRGSPASAPTVFAESGNLPGTIVGNRALAYSPEMSFLNFYVSREDLERPCYRDSHPNSKHAFRGCMRTTSPIDGVPLAFPLPIELRIPSTATSADPGNFTGSGSSTLKVFSHGDYIGDFTGFRDEVMYVYEPSSQRLMGVNQVTGILAGGVWFHLFLDDQCTQNMARSSIWKRQSCPLTTEEFVPPRSEIWSHLGGPEGWKIGQYILQSTGPNRVVTSLYRTRWNWLTDCQPESPQCVQDAIKLPDFPLSFPTPIEIRKEPW